MGEDQTECRDYIAETLEYQVRGLFELKMYLLKCVFYLIQSRSQKVVKFRCNYKEPKI